MTITSLANEIPSLFSSPGADDPKTFLGKLKLSYLQNAQRRNSQESIVESEHKGLITHLVKDEFGREFCLEIRESEERIRARLDDFIKNIGYQKLCEDANFDKFPPLKLPVGGEFDARNFIDVVLKNQSNLLLYGKSGTLKTLIMLALAKEAVVMRKSPCVIQWGKFMGSLKSSLRNKNSEDDGGIEDKIDEVSRSPVLFIDELAYSGRSAIKDFERDTLYQIVNYREASGLPWVITMNFSEEELSVHFKDAIFSRMFNVNRTVRHCFDLEPNRRLGER